MAITTYAELKTAVADWLDRTDLAAKTDDFIDFYYGSYHFHTFNVADSAITIGIVLMAFDALRRRRTEPAESPS